ncbi:MAG: GNAT family N-acetyltransferase [Theionarchaea archaeon]|nr:GNAT family N-acetyltransferase [Theionarchaea archaeon]
MEIPDVILKPAEVEDGEILAEICKKAFDSDSEVGAPGTGGPPGYDTAEAQIHFMRFLDYYKIVGERIVGGIMVDSLRKEHVVLERIFVDPDVHRKGIGTRACELLWELYPDAKIWTLGTPEWNLRTKCFYEKLGFVQIGWDFGVPLWRGRWYQKYTDSPDSYEFPKIATLENGMRKVTVEGEILEKSDTRQVHSRKKGELLCVANAAMGDETGRIVLVLWNEQIGCVSVGDRVRVENGYVDSFRDVLQLNIGRIGRLITLI